MLQIEIHNRAQVFADALNSIPTEVKALRISIDLGITTLRADAVHVILDNHYATFLDSENETVALFELDTLTEIYPNPETKVITVTSREVSFTLQPRY